MSNFKVAYLRIETPQTKDGINLKYQNGQVVYKETHAPKEALKAFEKLNVGLPEHLRHKLSIVDENAFVASQVIRKPEPIVQKEIEEKPKKHRMRKPKSSVEI